MSKGTSPSGSGGDASSCMLKWAPRTMMLRMNTQVQATAIQPTCWLMRDSQTFVQDRSPSNIRKGAIIVNAASLMPGANSSSKTEPVAAPVKMPPEPSIESLIPRRTHQAIANATTTNAPMHPRSAWKSGFSRNGLQNQRSTKPTSIRKAILSSTLHSMDAIAAAPPTFSLRSLRSTRTQPIGCESREAITASFPVCLTS
mmetsp:Transcript_26802/g.61798  ORF Transcript_26802/g.61798 Transcript_26802/m.61798 type:complete len:200 (+) Transcript_26802:484-1083(+)